MIVKKLIGFYAKNKEVLTLKTKNINVACMMIIFSILLIIYGIIFSENENTKINLEKNNTLSEGWKILNDNKNISLPYKFHSEKDNTIVLTNTLPEYIDDNYSLCFLANYNINRIYIDDNLIYSYGNKKTLPISNMVGNIRCIVNLEKEHAGKEITWVITPYYTQDFEIVPLEIDVTEKIELSILQKNIWRIVALTILIILTLLIFVFIIYRLRHKIRHNNKILIYHNMFAITLASWILCSSDIPQFFTNNNKIVSLISFLSLGFMAPIYSGFNEYILKQYSHVFEKLKLIGLINIFIQLVLYSTNTKDPIEVLLLTHILFLINLIFAISCLLKSLSENKYLKILLLGDVCFSISALLALLSFYKHPGNGNDAIFLIIGFFILIISYLTVTIKNEVLMIKKAESAKFYKELAFRDSLTHLKNRAAYDKELEDIMKDKSISNINFILCDLNYLKTTNDTYGHEAGDLLIKEAARCIFESFNDVGSCFRLGGDEFLILITNKKDISSYIKTFNKNMENYNNSNDTKLSIAYGCSYTKSKEIDAIQEAFANADSNMYQMKLEQHANRP
jgi:diguanylate cyclase (GGDEF)-like protein